jgi:hypothetical protein
MGNLTGQSTLVTGYSALQVNNLLYLTNGLDRVKRFDGQNWQNAGIAKESFTPTLTPSGSGSLDGVYYYCFTFINKLIPIRSNRYPESLPVGPFAVTATTDAQIAITNLPATHGDTQVTHIRVYRSKADSYSAGSQFESNALFYVADVAIGTTSYNDTTLDDSLEPTQVEFKTNIPVPGRYMEYYGNRLWLAGNDPLSTGTATKNGTNADRIDFTGVTIPTGVVGAFFQADGDDARYEITAFHSSTQIGLASAFSGTLTSAAYTIWRERNIVWPSEQFNTEAFGYAGEGFRNWLEVGPRGTGDEITGLRAFAGSMLVFMRNSVWAISGNGVGLTNYAASTSPLWTQYGNVSKASGRSQFAEADGFLYWMSPHGPCRWGGSGAPQVIGQRLGDFQNNLTTSQLAKVCVGFAPTSREIWYACPEGASATENSVVYCYHIDSGEWYVDRDKYITYFFNDRDDDGRLQLFSCQGAAIFLEDVGTNDGKPASGTTSGTATAGSTTSLTDSGASFYTTGEGLYERVCHIFNSSGAYKGSGRIASNTGTVLTFTNTLSSAVASGDTYVIGAIYAYWNTRVYRQPTKASKTGSVEIEFGADSTKHLWHTSIVDGNPETQPIKTPASDRHINVGVFERGKDFQYKIEWRDLDSDVSVRSINARDMEQGETK